MKSLVLLAVVLGLVLGYGGQVKAGILYNDLPGTYAGSGNLVGSPLANSFSTGAIALNLTDVKLVLSATNPSDGASFSVNLLSTNTSTTPPSPGSVLETIATLRDSSLTTTPTLYDYFPPQFSLQANTRYWIQVSSSNGSSVQWAYTYDTSGVGVANEYTYYNGVEYTNPVGGPNQFEVIGTVPEPASLSLFFVGTIGVLGYSWRRRKLTALAGQSGER